MFSGTPVDKSLKITLRYTSGDSGNQKYREVPIFSGTFYKLMLEKGTFSYF